MRQINAGEIANMSVNLKWPLMFVLALMLLVAPAGLPVAKADQMVVTVLKIKGMMCGSCAQTVEKTLRKLDGVRTVDVELKKDKAVVAHDRAKVTPRQMVEALGKVGYEAEPM